MPLISLPLLVALGLALAGLVLVGWGIVGLVTERRRGRELGPSLLGSTPSPAAEPSPPEEPPPQVPEPPAVPSLDPLVVELRKALLAFAQDEGRLGVGLDAELGRDLASLAAHCRSAVERLDELRGQQLRERWVESHLVNLVDALARLDGRAGQAGADALRSSLAVLFGAVDVAARRLAWFRLEPVRALEDRFDPSTQEALREQPGLPALRGRVVGVERAGLVWPDGTRRKALVVLGS